MSYDTDLHTKHKVYGLYEMEPLSIFIRDI